MRKDKGIVTRNEFAEVVDGFLIDQQWRPSPQQIALQVLHQHLLDWLAANNIPFAIPQRMFCILLIERGFRAAYTNIKIDDDWRFRKIVFAKQGASL